MQGYTLIEGKYYNIQDGSGPYAIAEDSSVTLMSASGISALGELVMLGGWYFDKSNASGPYALDSDGVTHLIVGGSGGGGGDVTWSTLPGKPPFIAAGTSATDVAVNKLGLRTGAFSNILAYTVQADAGGSWSVDMSGTEISSIVTVQVTAGVARGIASVATASTTSITGTLMSGNDATPLSVNTLAPTAGTVYVLVYFN